MGGRGLSGRGAAPGAPGPGHGLAGGPAGRAPTAAGAGQRGRAHGAAQGGAAGEGGASLSVREAPLWLRDGAVSGPGEEPDPTLPVVWAGEPVARGALSDGVSGSTSPRGGA